MKLSKLQNPATLASIQKLMRERIPGKVGLKIAKLVQKIETELAAVDKARLAQCEELCEKDENGKSVLVTHEDGKTSYKLSAEANAAIGKHLGEMLDVEFDLVPVQLGELGDKLENMTGGDWFALDGIIVDDEPAKAAG